jgi:hypothetical protein
VAADAYFVRLDDDRFRATERTSGAWAEPEQHIAPMIGLLVHEIERTLDDEGKVLGRLSVDILGVIAVDEFVLVVDALRPGRTIALTEARVIQGGRTIAIARAWHQATYDTRTVAGDDLVSIPRPDELPPWDISSVWPGGYIGSLEVRRAADARPGRAVAWVRTPVPVLADEPISDLARWMGLVDTANGLSVRAAPTEWLFPNVDLTIHLHRLPHGPWVGFDTTVTFGASGLGVTSTVLHDLDGPVGHAAQQLTIRPA